MKPIKGKPVATPLGTIIPSCNDRLHDGSEINHGSVASGHFLCEATVTNPADGKAAKLEIIASGATLVLVAPESRRFALNIGALIDHAIAHGLLDSTLTFEPAT